MQKNIRAPSVAGSFYPLAPGDLKADISKYLQDVVAEEIDGSVVGIIVPHAGYVYSGSVAAHAFKALDNISPRDVLLVGPSHYVSFSGISVFPKGCFSTPLGNVSINSSIAENYLTSYEEVHDYPHVHNPEHALEVELPFLQSVLEPGFNIVPLLVGASEEKTLSALSKIMSSFICNTKDTVDKERLVVVSVDLSHYHSYDVAKKLDMAGLEAILNIEPDVFWDRVLSKETEIDAPGVVYSFLKVCRKLNIKSKLLKYANSGDVSGDKQRVVGYSAVVFYI